MASVRLNILLVFLSLSFAGTFAGGDADGRRVRRNSRLTFHARDEATERLEALRERSGLPILSQERFGGPADDDWHGGDECKEVVIQYNDYGISSTSENPTIGNGNGTADPRSPDYGAMRIFIQKAEEYTSALPGRNTKVSFVPIEGFPLQINALRPGVQLATTTTSPPVNPPFGFLYNSMPFAMQEEHWLEFLYEAEATEEGLNGIELAQEQLDNLGSSQVAFPVVGSTSQGSGYFPKPIGKPLCHEGDQDCEAEGDGIGLAGLCTSGWEIRFLDAPGQVINVTCHLLKENGVIENVDLEFYPPVGGESVLKPAQNRDIQGFEFITPFDDLKEFFPVKEGGPDSGQLNCTDALEEDCSQNIGQVGLRYAHYPGWHQPFLTSWMHVDKDIWFEELSRAQRAAILRAAKESVSESYGATESVQCEKLRDIIDFNVGIEQLNQDGSLKLEDGNPISARMTMTEWPKESLDALELGTSVYLNSLKETNREFAIVYGAMQNFTDIPVSPEELPPFPSTLGLVPGEPCKIAPPYL